LAWRLFIIKHYIRRTQIIAILMVLALTILTSILVITKQRSSDPGTNPENGSAIDSGGEVMVVIPRDQDSDDADGGNPAALADSVGNSTGGPDGEVVEPVTIDASSPQTDQNIDVDGELRILARSYDFSDRRVRLPEHPILGVLVPEKLRGQDTRLIYQRIADIRFWNSLDVAAMGREDNPEAPFREVRIGELEKVSEERYRTRIRLDSFSQRYFIEFVLYSTGDSLLPESFRYLE
jgi:hypothetical protein